MSDVFEEEVPSPCVSVCSMDETSGLCLGCFRTLDEISNWWDLSSLQKQTIIEHIEQRQQGQKY